MPLALPTQDTASVGGILTAALWNKNVRDAANFLLNPPFFVAYQAVAQSLANITFVGNYIHWDTVSTDPYTGWATGSNTRYTAQVAGWYSVRAHVTFAANATGVRAAAVALNGTNIATSQQEVTAETATGPTSVPIDHMLQLAVGDYIEIGAYQGSGGALNTQANYSWLAVKWDHA